MNDSSGESGRGENQAILLMGIIIVVILIALRTSTVLAIPLGPYYQISPMPTFTRTATPVLATPTDTPAPPTPTDTPAPPTPTDTPAPPTPTDTPAPPTPTDTPAPPNSPPVIDAITGPTEPVAISEQPVTIAVAFSDPDSGDTHTVSWDWGDGSPIDTQTGATSPATQSHTYAAPGVYTVQVTVTDDGGAFDGGTYEFIVIFDPTGGYITGKGLFDSPSGAYTPDDPDDPDLTGEARFGFISRYRVGASTPSGSTVFQFRTARLAFYSDNYQWLIVNQNDGNAQIKGVGIIKGSDQPHHFMIWAGDGNPDSYRIKIWRETPAGELRLYDNGTRAPITEGSIDIYDGR